MDSVFTGFGFESNGFFNVTPREALEICAKGAILVDVRETMLTGYKKFMAPQVIYVPFSRLKSEINNLPINKPLIIADSAGIHSREAMLFLKESGFNKLANLAGGLVEWERDKLPLIINQKERLDGSCMCQLRPRNK